MTISFLQFFRGHRHTSSQLPTRDQKLAPPSPSPQQQEARTTQHTWHTSLGLTHEVQHMHHGRASRTPRYNTLPRASRSQRGATPRRYQSHSTGSLALSRTDLPQVALCCSTTNTRAIQQRSRTRPQPSLSRVSRTFPARWGTASSRAPHAPPCWPLVAVFFYLLEDDQGACPPLSRARVASTRSQLTLL